MGKPYQSELLSLPHTYEWAVNHDLGILSRLREELAGCGLYSIGSGGSLSAAAYGAYLHGISCGGFGYALTLLEFCAREQLRSSAVLIYSAGGGNVDVIAALRHAVRCEAGQVATMCLAPESKLAMLSSHYQYVHSWAERSPVDGDGFLATNSLLTFFVLSHRMFQPQCEMPSSYVRLRELAHYSVRDAKKLVQQEHLIVLHGPSTRAAALDFESKMSEAGLSSVQLVTSCARVSCNFACASVLDF
jgi:fructoselysine-6-P-deglycase FrlB-like protein